MDHFQIPLKKSFKSIRQGRKSSKNRSPERVPILLDHDHSDHPAAGSDQPEGRMSKNDSPDASAYKEAAGTSTSPRIWRESSYDFYNRGDRDTSTSEGSFEFVRQNQTPDAPPSKMIGHFVNNQKNNNINSEIALDMDLDMEELKSEQCSRELRVSFEPASCASSRTEADSLRRRYKVPPQDQESGSLEGARNERPDEVVQCTSNASFQRDLSFLQGASRLSSIRVKTRSRLMDPPHDEMDAHSSVAMKSGQLRSSLLSRGLDDDEDDPLAVEDLPAKYRKPKLDAMTLLQWVSLFLIIAALICSRHIPALKEKSFRGLELWKWLVMVLVLICGRLVSGWGIRLAVFFIELNFLLRKRVLYFVYSIRKPVQNCLWLALVLISWNMLFIKRVERETNSEFLEYITKILVCFLVATLLWLVKTLVVKVLASSFHVSTYFDRIQETLFNQYVIETLSGPPYLEIQRNEEEEERTAAELQRLQNAGATVPPELRAAFPTQKSGLLNARASGMSARNVSATLKSGKFSRIKSSLRPMKQEKPDEGIRIDHLHKLTHRNISAWNMKRLMKMVRHGSLTTLDEQLMDTNGEDEAAREIRSEFEAKSAARKIFQNVARPGSKHIYLEDLLRFMKEDEVVKTLSLFEGACETRKISKRSLKEWMVNAFRERRALALTLNDTKTAVNKLHQIVNVIVAAIVLVIWLVILEIATSKFLLFISSQLVLVAFIFGNTCKVIFESIVFLFIIHPFDVGDRCEVDGIQMVVEEMNILTTVFLRYDNLKIIYPNSILSQKAISNFYRSPEMGDAIEFTIHIATPAEKLALIKQRVLSYFDNKKEHWCASPMFIIKDMEELNKVRVAIWPCHKMNHQNMGERFERRALVVEELVRILKELDIEYRLYPIDINVRALPNTISNRLPATWTDVGAS